MQDFFNSALNGNISDVKKRLNDGVDKDSQDEYGYTALIWASARGHEAVCELLITRGCNVDMQTKDGNTALMRASWAGHKAVCELLITRGCNLDMQDFYGGATALIYASSNGQIPVVISLIEAGCDYSHRDNEGKSAMDKLRQYHPDKVKEVQVSRSPTAVVTHSLI